MTANEECPDLSLFFEVAEQYPVLFVSATQHLCQPCQELGRLIKDADIPHPIVELPVDVCPEIADELGIEATPTVLRLEYGKITKKLRGQPENILHKMAES